MLASEGASIGRNQQKHSSNLEKQSSGRKELVPILLVITAVNLLSADTTPTGNKPETVHFLQSDVTRLS